MTGQSLPRKSAYGSFLIGTPHRGEWLEPVDPATLKPGDMVFVSPGGGPVAWPGVEK